MATAKKTAPKSTSKATAKKPDKVEARPIGQGKDPLAEGARLHNPSNTEGETHYDADNSELNAEETAAKNRINGQDANERAEDHNAQALNGTSDTPNSDQVEQNEVAAGRTEEANPPIDDTPDETEVPERTEEQENADAEDRQDAVETALKTTDKP